MTGQRASHRAPRSDCRCRRRRGRVQRNGGNAVSDRSSHRRTHGHADNRPQLRRPQLRRADICRAKLCRADVCRAKLCRPERLGLGSAKRIGIAGSGGILPCDSRLAAGTTGGTMNVAYVGPAATASTSRSR